MRGFIQNLSDPLVQADSLSGGGKRRRLVDIGGYAQNEFAGERLARFDPIFGARIKKWVSGFSGGFRALIGEV